MNMTRDEFIFKKLQETVWKGRIWHAIKSLSKVTSGRLTNSYCSCGKDFFSDHSIREHIEKSNPDFSTWPGFGMLLEGMMGHKDWRLFLINNLGGLAYGGQEHQMPIKYIGPAFADEVAKFFGGEEGE